MRELFRRRTPVLFLCLAFACAGLANQTIPLSIERLTRTSEIVLQGTVTSKSCQRDDRGRIYTKIVLNVADVWKGQVPPGFVMVQAGGVLGEEVTTVSGQEEFEIGEEVVVFLVLNPRGEGVVIGVSQGKFKILEENGSNEKTASNGFHGQARETAAGLQRSAARPLTVAELKQRVRAEAK
ncbi:MAG TPA: hypothetical protein VK846_11615 [Candidatus Limnocylindria bacterium]|nr:hypothetical protein [Candidatus Limnocylindria bacterium]